MIVLMRSGLCPTIDLLPIFHDCYKVYVPLIGCKLLPFYRCAIIETTKAAGELFQNEREVAASQVGD